MNNENNGQNNNSNNKQNKHGLVAAIIATCLIFLAICWIKNQMEDSMNREISYDEFLQMIDEDKVEEVEFQNNKIVIKPSEKDDKPYIISYYTGYIKNDELVKTLNDAGIKFSAKVDDGSGGIIEFFLYNIFPFVIIFGITWLMFRPMFKGGGMMGVGKSNAKVYVEKETGVTFRDVAGQEEAKESLTELVDFLHNPAKYAQIGAKLPKGALLVGPPGTGKTLLAKALAGEAKVPFFSMSGSDFVELYVGVGASRVRDLFKQAQQKAPCIIFIDEVDAIGKSRDGHYGGNDEREQTLNQLLSEMDGFDTSKGLVVLAATNRPEVLDKALLRPGRFDRRVIVDKPDLKGRIDILRVHAKDVMMDDSVDLEAIALATSGAVGSDLANMINEAAIMAVKEGRQFVKQADLFEAVEIVIAGKEKKDRILGADEKKIVAYHEVGHALVTALQKGSEPVQKITIVPRTMGALGYVMQVPEEEKYLMSQEEMINRIVTCLGGRAAEKIIFDSVTTGASNDIEQATKMARAMVTQYGMSDKFGMIGLESVENKYLDGRAVMNCSDTTAAEVDHEIMRILKECYQQAETLLKDNVEVLDKIADFLIQRETITGKEFMRIYREIKGIPEPEEEIKQTKQNMTSQYNSCGQLNRNVPMQGVVNGGAIVGRESIIGVPMNAGVIPANVSKEETPAFSNEPSVLKLTKEGQEQAKENEEGLQGKEEAVQAQVSPEHKEEE